MNELGYRISDENGLSFELLVDGDPLGDVIDSADNEIPYWIVGDDLPTFPPRSADAEPNVRIVTACSCGEYGCGHSQCHVDKTQNSVVFSRFDGDCSSDGRKMTFEFPGENYHSVVSEIVRLAREQRERDAAGRTT